MLHSMFSNFLSLDYVSPEQLILNNVGFLCKKCQKNSVREAFFYKKKAFSNIFAAIPIPHWE